MTRSTSTRSPLRRRLGAILALPLLAARCSTQSSPIRAAIPPSATTNATAVDTTRVVIQDTARFANPVGVWRGTSRCTQRPSSCNDEIVVYRITLVNAADSLLFDARKIVDGQEQDMGALGCRIVSGSQFTCSIPNGVWYFTVRGDSLVGDLRLPGNRQFRDVRAARSR